MPLTDLQGNLSISLLAGDWTGPPHLFLRGVLLVKGDIEWQTCCLTIFFLNFFLSDVVTEMNETAPALKYFYNLMRGTQN